jgi:hypothetical protein
MMEGTGAAALRALARTVPALASRHLVEIASVLGGARTCARTVVPAMQWAPAAMALEGMGLHVGAPSVHQRVVRRVGDDRYCVRVTGAPDPSDPESIVALIVSSDAKAAAQGQEIDDNDDSFACGLMLGYPDCCARAYASIESGTDWYRLLAAGMAPGMCRLHWSANCIAGLRTIDTLHPDFFPCRLGCPRACAFVRSLVLAARSIGLEIECTRGITIMSLPIVLLDGAAVTLASDGATPLGCEIRPGTDPQWKVRLSDPELHFQALPAGIVASREGMEVIRVRGTLVRFDGAVTP